MNLGRNYYRSLQAWDGNWPRWATSRPPRVRRRVPKLRRLRRQFRKAIAHYNQKPSRGRMHRADRIARLMLRAKLALVAR